MNQQKIDNVSKLNSNERYEYFIRKSADFETVYLITDNDDQYVLIGDNESVTVPVWPEEEFAKQHLINEWAEFNITEASVYDFIDWLSELEKEGIQIAGFPNIKLETILVSANDLKNHLEAEIDQYN